MFYPSYSVCLEWNAMGMLDNAFTIFCEGVAANNVLQALDLRNNQISHDSAAELCRALKQNSSIRALGEFINLSFDIFRQQLLVPVFGGFFCLFAAFQSNILTVHCNMLLFLPLPVKICCWLYSSNRFMQRELYVDIHEFLPKIK